MPKPSSLPRPSKLRSVLWGVVLSALALLVPASASAWVKEPAPAVGDFFQEGSSLSVLPDGSTRWIGVVGSNPYTNRLIVRPPAGPVGLANPFPAPFGSDDSDGILFLSPQDAAGNQLVVREESPYSVGFMAAGGDPAAVTNTPIQQVIAIDLAPSGEAAAIVSSGSEASLTFRGAGPGGSFDSPRKLDKAGNDRSYGVAVTVDPDGGVFVVYETQQDAVLLQTYAPPGQPFGSPQQIDIDDFTLGQGDFRYGASDNGHGVLVWDESTDAATNAEEVWAMTRLPGGLLGDKKLIATARADGSISVHDAAATDDGTSYAAYLDSGPISCPNNYRFGGSVLAVKPGAGEWKKLNEPTTGNARSTVSSIDTAGNAVGVLTSRLAYPSNVCSDKDASSSLEVQLGQGASLGPAETIASEAILGSIPTIERPRGFAVNAGGAAAVLVDEPIDTSNKQASYLYYQAGGPLGPPAPAPAGAPLKAPGKILISGKKLVAKANKTTFRASCTRVPGELTKVFCSISALLAIEEKLGGGKKSSASAVASAKARKKARLRVIATAKPVKVPAGKTKAITLKLNKLGKQKLAAAKKAGLKVTLKVTIKRAGYATNTIEKKVKLVPGKTKGKGNKGGSK